MLGGSSEYQLRPELQQLGSRLAVFERLFALLETVTQRSEGEAVHAAIQPGSSRCSRRSGAGGPPCHLFMRMLPSFCFQAVSLTIGAEDLSVRRAPFIKPPSRFGENDVYAS